MFLRWLGATQKVVVRGIKLAFTLHDSVFIQDKPYQHVISANWCMYRTLLKIQYPNGLNKRHLHNIWEVRLISPWKIIFPRQKWVNLPKYKKIVAVLSPAQNLQWNILFSNKNNFTIVSLRRIVNMKNMGAVTSDSNFQPNRRKQEKGKIFWDLVTRKMTMLRGNFYFFLDMACSNETGVECSITMEKQS